MDWLIVLALALWLVGVTAISAGLIAATWNTIAAMRRGQWWSSLRSTLILVALTAVLFGTLVMTYMIFAGV